MLCLTPGGSETLTPVFCSIATHGPYRRFSHGWGRDPKGRIEAHKDMVYSCTNAIALDTRRLSCS